MRDGALPAILLCLAFGLLLAGANIRSRIAATIVLVATAIVVGGFAWPIGWQTAVLLGSWMATALFVIGVYLSRVLSLLAAVLLALAAGVLMGAVTSEVGHVGVLYSAAPCVLIVWPAAWVVSRRWTIVLKVGASWLLAIAVLSAGVTLATGDPNAGSDHLD